jgi:hypothetical protein
MFSILRWCEKNGNLRRPTVRLDGCLFSTPLSGYGLLTVGRLEKFLSPNPGESDSVTARGIGRMERASHEAKRLFRC